MARCAVRLLLVNAFNVAGHALTAKHITSRDNPFFKSLHKLAESARERRKESKTLLDGEHLITAYVAAGNLPETLLLSQGAAVTPAIKALVDKLRAAPVIELAPGLFGELSPVRTPTGIMALIDIPQVKSAGQMFCILLEDIQDPGNLGSILRTAAAAGVQTAYLSAHCADAWSPKVLRAGMGAHFVLSIQEQANLLQVAQQLPGTLVAASLDAERSLFELDLTGSVAFAIGNEGAGLSAELSSLARQKVTIPMPGAVESLNAAAAAAICCFERVRQMQVRKI